MFLHTQQYFSRNISFRNTHFLRTLLLGLLSPNGNGRGICIREYVYLSIYKINFDSYVPTAPLGTVRKLECGIPTLSFSFVKKNGRAHLIRTQVHSDRNVYLSRFARYYLLSFQPPFQAIKFLCISCARIKIFLVDILFHLIRGTRT